jgi:hypothetical protein
MHRRMDSGLTNGLVDGLTNGLADGLTDGLTDGLKDRLTDGLKDRLTNGPTNGLWIYGGKIKEGIFSFKQILQRNK